jgi:hypothetical protein
LFENVAITGPLASPSLTREHSAVLDDNICTHILNMAPNVPACTPNHMRIADTSEFHSAPREQHWLCFVKSSMNFMRKNLDLAE